MTTIKASCPDCGELELLAGDIVLVVFVGEHDHLSYYAFTCTQCQREVRKPADDHVRQLLRSGGVQAQLWRVPAEISERRDEVGPPIDYDDLLDIGLDLLDDTRLAVELVEMTEVYDTSRHRYTYP